MHDVSGSTTLQSSSSNVSVPLTGSSSTDESKQDAEETPRVKPLYVNAQGASIDLNTQHQVYAAQKSEHADLLLAVELSAASVDDPNALSGLIDQQL